MSETAMTIKEAKAIIKAAIGEVSLWQQLTPNLQKVGAAMAAFEEMEAARAKDEAAFHDLQQRIESAATCCAYDETQAREATKRKEAAMSECKAEERKLADLRARCGQYERIEELDAAISDKRRQLGDLTADLESLKARHF